MARRSVPLIMVGDVGEIFTVSKRPPLPSDAEIELMDNHQLFAILLEQGVKVYDIIGVTSCGDHYDMVLQGPGAMPQGYNMLDHTKYCKNCFRLFRIKKLVE